MNRLIKYIVESRFNFNIDLLDLEDNGEGFSLSKQLYKSKSMKQEYIENNLFVDLGLPSGTKWCKYNLGCDFDLLASKPESTSPKDWYGKYYAWGEIEEKDYYGWKSYKFEKNISDSRYNFVKYCTDSDYGYKNFTDGLSRLLPEDDVAYLTNSGWRMPTKELFDELLKNTNNKWISGENSDLYMNVKGLTGRLFTSVINGNQLFIPAAGYMDESSLYYSAFRCYLWSSSLDTINPDYACCLYSVFIPDIINVNATRRYNGLSVRFVIMK